jgi:putative membrane protein
VNATGEAVRAEEPRQRLHPLSPLLHGAKSIAVIAAALSWQTLREVGLERFAIVVAVLAVCVVIYSAIGWLTTGFHIVGRELRIQDGVFNRRSRAIPLDRLQAVEVRRPLLAQLTGLAELRLEVVGGGKTEAPLAYLSVRNASALRERLLALAGHAPGSGAHEEPAARGPAYERPLVRVRIADLFVSQLLTPQAFFLPFGVAFVVLQFTLEGSWTFVGIASTMTAMAGVLLQPVRRVSQDWNFRLSRDADGRLAVRYGLTDRRSQVVPLNRVQSIGVTWPFLWRAKRWMSLRLDIAGIEIPTERSGARNDRLLPVGLSDQARMIVWEVLPGVDFASLQTAQPPVRARWLHPIAQKRMGVGLTDAIWVVRYGILKREMTLVPYARIQSVRIVQGPLERLLNLATVFVDTAGGRASSARSRDLNEARWLASEVATRARLARAPRPLKDNTVPAPPPVPATAHPPMGQPPAGQLLQDGQPAHAGAPPRTPAAAEWPTPAATAPAQTAPEQATPEQTAPEQATPEHAAPEQATPEHAAPEQATPVQAAREQAVSERAVSGEVAQMGLDQQQPEQRPAPNDRDEATHDDRRETTRAAEDAYWRGPQHS